MMHIRWVLPKRGIWGKSGQIYRKTTGSPRFKCVFLVSKRTLYFSGGWFFGCFISVGLGIPGLVRGLLFLVSFLLNFANIGGWLTYGDLAMDSCAQFLAVAEHRLIPARARSVGHQLRKAGFHSVWAPACQDSIPGGHAGVGVVSLGCSPMALLSFVTPEFREFFSVGKGFENHSSYWERRSSSLVCCLWLSGC